MIAGTRPGLVTTEPGPAAAPCRLLMLGGMHAKHEYTNLKHHDVTGDCARH